MLDGRRPSGDADGPNEKDEASQENVPNCAMWPDKDSGDNLRGHERHLGSCSPVTAHRCQLLSSVRVVSLAVPLVRRPLPIFDLLTPPSLSSSALRSSRSRSNVSGLGSRNRRIRISDVIGTAALSATEVFVRENIWRSAASLPDQKRCLTSEKGRISASRCDGQSCPHPSHRFTQLTFRYLCSFPHFEPSRYL